jgi:tripartite-type tricarboxylate transporter receptor subunit TctC
MGMLLKFFRFLSAILLSIFVFSVQAQTPTISETYPKRPIKLVVPYPPGGGADTLARIVAAKLSEKIKQTVIVENKPGGNTAIASEYVSNQAPDGYTLLYVASSFTINPSLYKLRFSTQNDFSPIALIAQVPLIIISNKNEPYKTVSELIKAAKLNPGQISYATFGTGSPVHMAAELFQVMTDTKLLHVPYKGSAPGLTDLVGGQVNIAFSSIEPALALLNSKKVNAIAVTTAQRIAAAPEIPALSETIPGFEATGWNGIVAPAGTPAEIVGYLNKMINEVVLDKDVSQKFASQGVQADLKTPEAFSAMIHSELFKWSNLVNSVGIKSED